MKIRIKNKNAAFSRGDHNFYALAMIVKSIDEDIPVLSLKYDIENQSMEVKGEDVAWLSEICQKYMSRYGKYLKE